MIDFGLIAESFTQLYFAWCSNEEERKPLEGCDPEKYKAWNCCEHHRRIRWERHLFGRMAEAFDIVTPGELLSQRWFLDLAGRYGFQIPTRDRPSWWISRDQS